MHDNEDIAMNRLTQAQPLHQALSLILFGSALLWACPDARSDARFSPPRAIALGDEHLAIGDLNGDKRPDLVIARRGKLSVLLGDGRGRFAPKLRPVQKGTMIVGQIPVLADFNGDGKLDLATLQPGDSEPPLSIFLGRGNGRFAPKTEVTAPILSGGSAMVAADMNGDGKPDLAIRNDSWHFTILLGQGDGNFEPASDEPVALPDDPANGGFIAADVNDDGKDDLIVTGWNFSPGKLRILLGNSEGRPQVNDPVTFDAHQPAAITAADFNGDGKIDLATANQWAYCEYNGSLCFPHGADVTVLLGNGDGTFKALGNFPPDEGAEAIAATDIDGNGSLDLVTANLGSAQRGSISILPGVGDGSFQTHQDLIVPVTIPAAIAAADINSDGRPDILVTPNRARGIGKKILLLTNRTAARR
ncbi:MAG: VCBS repeat-containing protein [Methylococcaceae bacterium]|nr:VCBS repeat-containing protein [Methylococcaceae bacterium]